MWIHLTLCIISLIICEKIYGLDPISAEEPTRTHPYRRAVDGTRGSKYYDPGEDDSFDIYDPYDEETDFSDYRSNVPGEPGIDYPSYTRIPQTSFTCESQYRGYYADDEAGCQLFHVCDGNFLVSSFLCPVGSIFSQKLLTCDWWNKVDCTSTKRYYHTINEQPEVTQVDDDEFLRKAYEMTSLQSADNRVSVDPRDQIRNLNQAAAHINDLQSTERYSDYHNSQSKPSYPQFKYSSRYSGSRTQNTDYNDYSDGSDETSSIKIHTIGKDRKDEDDSQYNQYHPSYAPTVPTITTTTRRYYSPTVPTIIRSTPRSRFDLEFESSDHLYSAKGKIRSKTTTTVTPRPTTSTTPTTITTTRAPTSTFSESTTEKPVHRLIAPINTIKKSLVIPEIQSSLEKILNSSEDLNIIRLSLLKPSELDEDEESATAENSYTFPESPIFNIIPYSDKNESDPETVTSRKEPNVLVPALSFLPPIYYYTDSDQENSVIDSKPDQSEDNSTAAPEEIQSTTSWYDETAINVPPIVFVPPIKDHLEDETLNADENGPVIPHNCTDYDLSSENKISSSFQSNSAIEHSLFDTENGTYSADNYRYDLVNGNDNKFGTTGDFVETSTSVNFLKNFFDEKKRELLGDLEGGESSPVEVTVTVKDNEELDPSGEFIRSLIAQHDPIAGEHFRDIEIVKSRVPNGKDSGTPFQASNNAVREYKSERIGGRSRVINYGIDSSLKTRSKLGTIDVNNKNVDNVPRPFSINQQDILAISGPNHFYGEKIRTTTTATLLPIINQSPEKEENFFSSTESSGQTNLPTSERYTEFQSKKNSPHKAGELKQKVGSEQSWSKTKALKERFIVETELVPSISFSLNTEEEREEYAEAVQRGLLTDIPPSGNNVTFEIDTDSVR